MTRPNLDDIRSCLRLYSRLPTGGGRDSHAMPDLTKVAWAAPVTGALIGAVGAAALAVCHVLRLPTLVTATLAIATLALVTGAMHEDGVADMTDGFGGGSTPEAKLSIMRDSRIGAYGALALCFVVLLRVAALGALADRGAWLAGAALVAAGAVSRAAGLLPAMLLPAARSDGAGAAAKLTRAAIRYALVIAVMLGLCPTLAGASVAQSLAAQLCAFMAASSVVWLARRQIGGYTGDVLGGAQQAAEAASLIAMSAG